MLKRAVLTIAVFAAVAVGAGLPSIANAHGRHHRHWRHRPYLAGPPIVLRGSYYPVQYYYAPPYWYDYGYYGPYYGRGFYYSAGW